MLYWITLLTISHIQYILQQDTVRTDNWRIVLVNDSDYKDVTSHAILNRSLGVITLHQTGDLLITELIKIFEFIT